MEKAFPLLLNNAIERNALMKGVFLLGLSSMVVLGMGLAHAAPADSAEPLRVAAADTKQAAVSGTGVVEQVKAEQGKIKINHEPIPALDWPSMSMYFRVKDKAVLEGIATGDKVQFDLEKGKTGLEITRIEKVSE